MTPISAISLMKKSLLANLMLIKSLNLTKSNTKGKLKKIRNFLKYIPREDQFIFQDVTLSDLGSNHLFKIDNKMKNPLFFSTNADCQWVNCSQNVP